MPVLNEANQVGASLTKLSDLIGDIEVIVVDGGSTDDTVHLIESTFDRVTVLPSAAGRATQMNVGASHACADRLLFLHSDTRLPDDWLSAIKGALDESEWGRFDVALSSRKWWARMVSVMMNWRSRQFGIATGDQGLFMTHKAFDHVGGFPDQPLMEDVEISIQLKRRVGRPACLHQQVITSSRRWETHGVMRTIGLMWLLRFYYWIGVPASRLHRMYY